MASGPVCAMVWEGKEVVKTGRALLGATNPLASQPGTIRGDFAIVSFYLRKIHCLTLADVCHGSDGVESAKKEIALWFDDKDLANWKQQQHDWIYEK